jgi:hypothetical protein
VTRVYTKSAPAALFAGAVVGSEQCLVAAAAAGHADLGAVGMVLVFIPGQLSARVVVIPRCA